MFLSVYQEFKTEFFMVAKKMVEFKKYVDNDETNVIYY